MWLLWLAAWWAAPAGPKNTAAPAFWVEVAARRSPTAARALADGLQPSRAQGNRLLQTLILQDSDEEGARVWVGPFFRRVEAFSHGLSLLEDPHRRVDSFSLRRFDGVPVNLQVPAASRALLRLSRAQPPWPQVGVALFPLVGGYLRPQLKMPPLGAAVVRLGYRDEVWIQEETEVCEQDQCRRWFYAVTPSPHRLAWFPAGQVVPVSAIRSRKTPDGQVERYLAALRTGRQGEESCALAVSFFGSRRPLRWTFCRRGFEEGRLTLQEDGNWAVLYSGGSVLLGKSPAWLPVESLYRSTARRQFF